MYGKKQRIISFLMALLLIFTFAFISPLTVAKSDAFAFAVPVLTAEMANVILGVLVSAGYIIHTANSSASTIELMDMSEVIYQTLDNLEKIKLGALSIIENVVEVPKDLYNSIVSGAEKVLLPDSIQSLTEQGISTKYMHFDSTNTSYPDLTVPLYVDSTQATNTTGIFNDRLLDLRDAQPYFIYEGTGSGSTGWEVEGIKYFFDDFANENLPVYSIDGLENAIFMTPDLSPYAINVRNASQVDYVRYQVMYINSIENTLEWQAIGYGNTYKSFFRIPHSYVPNINDCLVYSYFVKSASGTLKIVTDIYNKNTGSFALEIVNDFTSYTINSKVYEATDTPYDYDLSIAPDTATVIPSVPSVDGSSNVITLPSEITDVVGMTSADVNVGNTDVPDDNTETMDRIDSNVGELVTGGSLGEQVNSNIGTIEGLHGEIMEDADFESVFDVINQYISSLEITNTWFAGSIALAIAPFMPLISLGIIIIFIDRVLNGGA